MSAVGTRRRALLGAGLGAALPAAAAMLAVHNDWAPGRLRWRCRVRNTSGKVFWLLTWNTPFEDGWWAPLGLLSRDGVALDYRGPQAKRGEPEASDYLRLAPGQQREALRDLTQVHDGGQPGRYRFATTWHWHDAFQGGRPPRPREQHHGLAVPEAVLTASLAIAIAEGQPGQ